jgi:hypothetical protein
MESESVMPSKRIIGTLGLTAFLCGLALLSAPAASAAVVVNGVHGTSCVEVDDPYVTVTPSITAGAGKVFFYGVSSCD